MKEHIDLIISKYTTSATRIGKISSAQKDNTTFCIVSVLYKVLDTYRYESNEFEQQVIDCINKLKEL